ncbi:hypothetical protein [Acetobacterium carbinolicum]|uniref:hypothetical protein n=1 Tax=Acetobacterium carbinolicum TaxID=52690 RepID=UPI0039C91164
MLKQFSIQKNKLMVLSFVMVFILTLAILSNIDNVAKAAELDDKGVVLENKLNENIVQTFIDSSEVPDGIIPITVDSLDEANKIINEVFKSSSDVSEQAQQNSLIMNNEGVDATLRNYITLHDVNFTTTKSVGPFFAQLNLVNSVTLRSFHRASGNNTTVLNSVNNKRMYLTGNTTAIQLYDTNITTTGIGTTTLNSKGTGLVDLYLVVAGVTVKNTSEVSIYDYQRNVNIF